MEWKASQQSGPGFAELTLKLPIDFSHILNWAKKDEVKLIWTSARCFDLVAIRRATEIMEMNCWLKMMIWWMVINFQIEYYWAESWFSSASTVLHNL